MIKPTLSPTLAHTDASSVIDIDPATPAPHADAWTKIRRYAEHAALFQRASLACQIMAGLELIALRDATKRPGKRSDTLSGNRTRSFLDEVETLGGISRSTAYQWMDMAKTAKPRLAKGDLDLAFILDKHPGSLTPAEQELLNKAVHKISDGRTQMQFLLECGVTKAPQGSAAKGGDTRAAAAANAAAAAQDDGEAPISFGGWEPRAKHLNALLVECLGDGWQNECHEAQRAMLAGNLLDLYRAVAATLKTKA